jgi:DNA-binding MarR family transcriptional regulator
MRMEGDLPVPSEKIIKRIVGFASRLEGIDPKLVQEGLEIAHLHHQIEQVIENDLAGWGLTARQVEAMEALYHNTEGTLTPADLADEVSLTRSAMTSSLDSLEKLGHIVRLPHPTDRRMVAVSLTPSGRQFIGHRLPQRYRRFHRVMSSLSKDERAAHLRTYRKVLDILARDIAEARK